MVRRLIYLTAAAVVYVSCLSYTAVAAEVSREEFANAAIEMERGKPEDGQRVQSLLTCLKNWRGPGNVQDNKVMIERNGPGKFTVRATLSGPTLFHFDVRQEQGNTVALLNLIEYQRPGEMFDNIRSTEGKRTVLRSVCSAP